MTPKEDIHNRNDLKLVVEKFYDKAIYDDVIGHFFTSVIPIHWEEHINIVTDFWDSIIFGTSVYKSNPMVKHFELNELSAMENVHFNRWLKLWKAAVNDNFTGTNAQEIINRAISIARIMEYKIKQIN